MQVAANFSLSGQTLASASRPLARLMSQSLAAANQPSECGARKIGSRSPSGGRLLCSSRRLFAGDGARDHHLAAQSWLADDDETPVARGSMSAVVAAGRSRRLPAETRTTQQFAAQTAPPLRSRRDDSSGLQQVCARLPSQSCSLAGERSLFAARNWPPASAPAAAANALASAQMSAGNKSQVASILPRLRAQDEACKSRPTRME